MSWLETQRARGTLRPFPVAPLARKLGLAAGDTGLLALRLDLNRGTVSRYRSLGLTLEQADEWARRGDLWPGSVWSNWERADLRGVALVNAGKETCAEGHPLDRVDAAGFRRCSRCSLAAVRRCRERKILVTGLIAVPANHRASLVLLDGGVPDDQPKREPLIAHALPDLRQRVDELATAAGLSRSAWMVMTLSAAVRAAEQPAEQVAS